MMIRITRNKYRNKPETVDGLRFASQKEAARYRELMMLQRAGEISLLECQRPYPLVMNGVPICKYIADFVYFTKLGLKVVEDVKGMLTPVYRIKAKMMWAQYGIAISEVGRKPRKARRKKLAPPLPTEAQR